VTRRLPEVKYRETVVVVATADAAGAVTAALAVTAAFAVVAAGCGVLPASGVVASVGAAVNWWVVAAATLGAVGARKAVPMATADEVTCAATALRLAPPHPATRRTATAITAWTLPRRRTSR